MKSARLKERELIIKLHDDGRSSYEIAGILGISQTKASFWIRRHRRTGNLENRPRSGRPTPLKKNVLDSMKARIKETLSSSRKNAGVSSKDVLEMLEEEVGRKYTIRHTERLLHKMGFSLITPRVHHIKKDEIAQQRFREEFKKNSSRNMWAIQ